MNQVLAWLAGGSFLMSKTFKISLKTFKIGSSVQRDPAGLENSDWFNGFFFKIFLGLGAFDPPS